MIMEEEIALDPAIPSTAALTQAPEDYIRVSYHPRVKLEDVIFSLDGPLCIGTSLLSIPGTQDTPPRAAASEFGTYEPPYAPFNSRAEFEAAEHIVKNRLPPSEIDNFLLGLAGGRPDDGRPHSKGYERAYVWHSGQSNVSMKNSHDFLKMMKRAREYTQKVRFCCYKSILLV
jgi:hypothetical protein